MSVLSIAVGELADSCNPHGLPRPTIATADVETPNSSPTSAVAPLDTAATSVPPRPSAAVSSLATRATHERGSEDGATCPTAGVRSVAGGAGTIAGRVKPGDRLRLYPGGPIVDVRRVVIDRGSVVIRFDGATVGTLRWPYRAPVEVIR